MTEVTAIWGKLSSFLFPYQNSDAKAIAGMFGMELGSTLINL